MATDSFLSLACTGMIGLLFGSILAFSGYRFFIFLLPIWGFFWGFGLGAQSIQALFGNGFLSDITSWVVGFFVGLLFAVLSYFFFAAAVAILAGSLGYALGVGIMVGLFGANLDVLTWIVGIVVAILFVVGVFALDLYKWAIIIATSVMGAGVIVGTMLLLLGKLPTSAIIENPVKAALNATDSIWLWITGIVVAILGFAAQYQSTRNWTLKSYNRMDEIYPTTTADDALMASSAGVAATGGMTPAMMGGTAGGGASNMPAPPADVPPATGSSSEPPAGGTA